ncbi:MAG: DnaJ domain-containing protein [Neisseriaceae bacterium]|nr:DnaJ domain-containing protein [Neisseriaceae bacterium]
MSPDEIYNYAIIKTVLKYSLLIFFYFLIVKIISIIKRESHIQKEKVKDFVKNMTNNNSYAQQEQEKMRKEFQEKIDEMEQQYQEAFEKQQQEYERENQKQNNKTYAEILGVAENASKAEIKAAYRRKMQSFHPDKNPNITPEVAQMLKEQAQKINEAYEFLMQNAKD